MPTTTKKKATRSTAKKAAKRTAKKKTAKKASGRKKTAKKASGRKKTAKKASGRKKTAKKASRKTVGSKAKGFKVGTRTTWSGEKIRILNLLNTNLVSVLMRVCQVRENYSRTRGESGWYVTENELLTKVRRIEKLADEHESYRKYLKGVLGYLQQKVEERMEIFTQNKEAGFIVFQDLWLMYYEGQEVVFDDNGAFVAGEVTKAKIYSGWGGAYYSMTLKIIGHDGNKFVFRDKECAIPYFNEGERINNLPVQPLTDKMKKRLSERGAKVINTIQAGSSYIRYDGEVLVRSYWGNKRYRARGRCMLDPKTHKRMNENYERRYASAYVEDLEEPEDTNTKQIEEIGAEDFWRVSPWIPGFSFVAKQWGECNIEQVSPIKFNTAAYDQLVLPSREVKGLEIAPKKMIRSLVEHGAIGFTDVIADKGGGIIFLLHGPPGTGKTLTAEAIADLLQRPLYSVSVGELGTNTEVLEKNLRTVLEVATLWNAVLLIDEADIFLEKRTPRDIERNALVAIFLRMLEYYQGVLFLTTNRVRQFDPAFNSRLSIALHYPDHDTESRASIWNNLMLAAKLDPKKFDIKRLAEEDVNGRQIKHAIRIGLSLAANDNRSVSMDDFMKTIILAQQFNEELGNGLTEEFEPVTDGAVSVVEKSSKKPSAKRTRKNGRSRARA